MTTPEAQHLAQIERKLDRLAVMMNAHQDRFEEQSEVSREWRQSMTRLLHGEDGASGLMVRVDRLEQTSERSRWVVRAMGGSAIAALGSALFALFKSG